MDRPSGLKEWITQNSLEAYYTAFISNGFVDLPSVSKLDPTDLSSIGLVKGKEKKRVAAAIIRLKEQLSSQGPSNGLESNPEPKKIEFVKEASKPRSKVKQSNSAIQTYDQNSIAAGESTESSIGPLKADQHQSDSSCEEIPVSRQVQRSAVAQNASTLTQGTSETIVPDSLSKTMGPAQLTTTEEKIMPATQPHVFHKDDASIPDSAKESNRSEEDTEIRNSNSVDREHTRVEGTDHAEPSEAPPSHPKSRKSRRNMTHDPSSQNQNPSTQTHSSNTHSSTNLLQNAPLSNTNNSGGLPTLKSGRESSRDLNLNSPVTSTSSNPPTASNSTAVTQLQGQLQVKKGGFWRLTKKWEPRWCTFGGRFFEVYKNKDDKMAVLKLDITKAIVTGSNDRGVQVLELLAFGKRTFWTGPRIDEWIKLLSSVSLKSLNAKRRTADYSTFLSEEYGQIHSPRRHLADRPVDFESSQSSLDVATEEEDRQDYLQFVDDDASSGSSSPNNNEPVLATAMSNISSTHHKPLQGPSAGRRSKNKQKKSKSKTISSPNLLQTSSQITTQASSSSSLQQLHVQPSNSQQQQQQQQSNTASKDVPSNETNSASTAPVLKQNAESAPKKSKRSSSSLLLPTSTLDSLINPPNSTNAAPVGGKSPGRSSKRASGGMQSNSSLISPRSGNNSPGHTQPSQVPPQIQLSSDSITMSANSPTLEPPSSPKKSSTMTVRQRREAKRPVPKKTSSVGNFLVEREFHHSSSKRFNVFDENPCREAVLTYSRVYSSKRREKSKNSNPTAINSKESKDSTQTNGASKEVNILPSSASVPIISQNDKESVSPNSSPVQAPNSSSSSTSKYDTIEYPFIDSEYEDLNNDDDDDEVETVFKNSSATKANQENQEPKESKHSRSLSLFGIFQVVTTRLTGEHKSKWSTRYCSFDGQHLRSFSSASDARSANLSQCLSSFDIQNITVTPIFISRVMCLDIHDEDGAKRELWRGSPLNNQTSSPSSQYHMNASNPMSSNTIVSEWLPILESYAGRGFEPILGGLLVRQRRKDGSQWVARYCTFNGHQFQIFKYQGDSKPIWSSHIRHVSTKSVRQGGVELIELLVDGATQFLWWEPPPPLVAGIVKPLPVSKRFNMVTGSVATTSGGDTPNATPNTNFSVLSAVSNATSQLDFEPIPNGDMNRLNEQQQQQQQVDGKAENIQQTNQKAKRENSFDPATQQANHSRRHHHHHHHHSLLSPLSWVYIVREAHEISIGDSERYIADEWESETVDESTMNTEVSTKKSTKGSSSTKSGSATTKGNSSSPLPKYSALIKGTLLFKLNKKTWEPRYCEVVGRTFNVWRKKHDKKPEFVLTLSKSKVITTYSSEFKESKHSDSKYSESMELIIEDQSFIFSGKDLSLWSAAISTAQKNAQNPVVSQLQLPGSSTAQPGKQLISAVEHYSTNPDLTELSAAESRSESVRTSRNYYYGATAEESDNFEDQSEPDLHSEEDLRSEDLRSEDIRRPNENDNKSIKNPEDQSKSTTTTTLATSPTTLVTPVHDHTNHSDRKNPTKLSDFNSGTVDGTEDDSSEKLTPNSKNHSPHFTGSFKTPIAAIEYLAKTLEPPKPERLSDADEHSLEPFFHLIEPPAENISIKIIWMGSLARYRVDDGTWVGRFVELRTSNEHPNGLLFIYSVVPSGLPIVPPIMVIDVSNLLSVTLTSELPSRNTNGTDEEQSSPLSSESIPQILTLTDSSAKTHIWHCSDISLFELIESLRASSKTKPKKKNSKKPVTKDTVKTESPAQKDVQTSPSTPTKNLSVNSTPKKVHKPKLSNMSGSSPSLDVRPPASPLALHDIKIEEKEKDKEKDKEKASAKSTTTISTLPK